MRSFLIVWVVAFCLIAAGASAVRWYVGTTPATPAVAETRRPVVSPDYDAETAGPFTEVEAVQVVGMRLPRDASGDFGRQQLQNSAAVTYHSVQHWRVCVDGACWVAHGPGRYAEPENDLARQREGRSSAAL